MKFIRELRAGKTKTFKTGAVVGSYPKPMLVFLFDEAGLDIIPTKAQPDLPVDIVSSDIVYAKPGTLFQELVKPTQPKVLAINYFAGRKNPLELDLRAAVPDDTAFINFVKDVDALFKVKDNPPFKSVVLDSVTGLQDLVFSFIVSKNEKMLADARQWAFAIGQKVKNTCSALTCINAHIVVIMHTEMEKNELSGQVIENPSVYSGLRNEIGAYFSQYFYAFLQGGKPMVSTTDYQFVKGLGMRWPTGLPGVCEPWFKTLYGKELA